MKQRGTLDRQRVPDNIIDREQGLEYRVQRLERLILTQEVASTLFIPIESPVALLGAAARVYRTVGENILNNTAEVLLWTHEEFDTDDFHSTTTNTDRLTIPADGLYIAIANITWQGNTAGERITYILLNGVANPVANAVMAAVQSTAVAQVVVLIKQLVAGDHLTVQVYQNCGVTLSVAGTSGPSVTTFSIARIG